MNSKIKNINSIKLAVTLLSVLCTLLLNSAAVSAADGVPYRTFFINSRGEPVMTQNAYIPAMIIDGFGIAEGEALLQNPEDIFISTDGEIYVADTGNRRIVVFGTNGSLKRIIANDALINPRGIFADANKDLYVADSGAEKVFIFGPDGTLKKALGKPDSAQFGKANAFKPQKVAADAMGSVYIVSSGSLNGLIQLDNDGKFLGYFGSNESSVDLLRRLQRLIFTDEQIARLTRVIPPSISNVAIDRDGLVYTATQATISGAVKRFNVAGSNLLKDMPGFSDSISDITVDSMGNIFAVDYKTSMVAEYNKNGSLVFLFGGSDIGRQQMGRIKSPSGIALDSSGRLYILDKERSNIQVYIPTEFAEMVHKATALYLDGRYVESRNIWEEVLIRNSMFELAHLGVGLADFKEQNYGKALEEFRVANYRSGYSEAFWEIRRVWIMKNLPAVIITLMIFMLLLFVFRRVNKKYRFTAPLEATAERIGSMPVFSGILFNLRIFRHPIDSYYEIRREKKGSIPSALFWLVTFTAVTIAGIYGTGYIFNVFDPRDVKLGQVILTIAVPFFLWVVCNYLVSTINDGEGSFRDVMIGTSAALMPVIVFALPLIVLSNGLTQMEQVIYTFMKNLAVVWSGILMFLMVKEIHDYEIGEAIKNILLTLFMMASIIIICVIFFGLTNQLWDFIYSIYQEVALHD